jgi:chromosome segregation ATPase
LKDLEAARAAARDEIAAAEADILQGRAFIAANDPDVGKEPEKLLVRAESALAQARAEIEQERPDWLQIIRLAHEANHLADEALRGARSEVEAMNRLREQLKRMQQVATAEVQKIVQFVSIHPRDIPVGAKDKINGLQINLQAAYAAAQSVDQKEEEARAAALRDAIERYTALEQQAASIYEEIRSHFQRLEAMRQRVRAESERAKAAISRAEQLSARAGSLVSRTLPDLLCCRKRAPVTTRLGRSITRRICSARCARRRRRMKKPSARHGSLRNRYAPRRRATIASAILSAACWSERS